MFLRHVRHAQAVFGGAAVLAMLGGCSKEAPTPEKVRQEAAQLVQPEPGRYRSETSLTRFDLPGAPADEARLMRERMGGVQPQVRDFCLSAEDAAKGFEPLIRQMQEGECRIEEFVANDSKLRARLQCVTDGGVSSEVELTGNAGARESAVSLVIRQGGPTIPGGAVNMEMEVKNRWLGPC